MTESNKIELFEKGYTTFNLYELNDSEINKSLDELYQLSKNEFKNLRYKKIGAESNSFINDSFTNLEEIKNGFKNINLYEIWYYNDIFPKNKFNNLLNKIKLFFYGKELDVFYHMPAISMYNDDCYLIEHSDGFNPNSKYQCVILIYLNKEDEIKEGGELILDGHVEIKPIMGTVAMMDFTKNDIRHGVKKVSNYERKCFVNFC